MKKHRASMAGLDDDTVTRRLGAGLSMPGAIGEILGSIDHAQASPEHFGDAIVKKEQDDEDEEL